MFLQNSQFVIEVVLMVVLVAGIVSSRLIVRRLGVIRESYTALNEMVATLDSSTEQVNHMFERVRHEVNQGDKRLSALLDRARNAEEDLADQQKMADESSGSLTRLLREVEEREAAIQALLASIRDPARALEAQGTAATRARAGGGAPARGTSGAAGTERPESPHFSDKLTMPVPGSLRSPRPYMRRRDSGSQEQAM